MKKTIKILILVCLLAGLGATGYYFYLKDVENNTQLAKQTAFDDVVIELKDEYGSPIERTNVSNKVSVLDLINISNPKNKEITVTADVDSINLYKTGISKVTYTVSVTDDAGNKQTKEIKKIFNVTDSTNYIHQDYQNYQEIIKNLSVENIEAAETILNNNKGNTVKNVSTIDTSTKLDTSDWRIALAYSYEGTVFLNCEYTAMKYLGEIGYWNGAIDDWMFRAFKKVSSPSFGTLIEYTGHVSVYLANNMCLHGGWNGNNVKVASCTLGSSQPILNYYDTTQLDSSTSNKMQTIITTWDSDGNIKTETKDITYEEYKNGTYYTKPHSHTYGYTPVDPTCTEVGYYIQYCIDCGEITNTHYDHFGFAKGHDYQNGVCTRCGGTDPNYVAPSAPSTDNVPEVTKPETPSTDTPTDTPSEETPSSVEELPQE